MTPKGASRIPGVGARLCRLVTGRMPPEFPLVRPQKLADNLIVLRDPVILPILFAEKSSLHRSDFIALLRSLY